ncbi:uncharacterized protein ASPGLDRAFT_233285 [Aspergillus glaucus CBS 516.65]|uniref:Uncharacterized protein n=1 Tax=Aspergillus glaucus CBS 516.65 TaxID=1160497 RepID=A0A1L9VZN4_ASPGL|nr:hypothetical protein ASPGLDRAFT_233285 [Aspergillus glaucus CBS 516.65]OJJ89372.1 hypothetical protein ASPGLDRAFT_233285 [Aspergillus glaucus CBS 516.65]
MNQKYWTLARYGWPGLLHAERLHVLYPDLFCHVFSLLLLLLLLLPLLPLLLQFLHGWSIMEFAFLDFRLLLYIQFLFSVRLGDRLVHRAAFFSSFHFFLSFFSFFFFLSFFLSYTFSCYFASTYAWSKCSYFVSRNLLPANNARFWI